MNLKKTLLPAFGLVLTCVAHAAQVAYATNYHLDLMRIDLTSPATQMIGSIGFVAEGLAATSGGTLYATNSAGKLFDVTGAIVTPVANMGSVSVGAMDSKGSTLWGWDNTSKRVFEYDPVSTSFLQWSTAMTNIPSIEAMAIDANGDFLFVSNASASVQRFGKIVKSSWTASVINSNMNLNDECHAIDFGNNGKLYAATWGDWRFEIDPTTGSQLSGFFSGVHRDWADMTVVPVPEPASLAALAGGLFLVLRKKRG